LKRSDRDCRPVLARLLPRACERDNAQGRLSVDGLPDAATEDALGRELVGIPQVLGATPRPPAKPRVYELDVAAAGSAGDVVAGILKPLNAKLGQPCFTVASVAGDTVNVAFDKACANSAVLGRLEAILPPASWRPAGAAEGVIKDPGRSGSFRPEAVRRHRSRDAEQVSFGERRWIPTCAGTTAGYGGRPTRRLR
jgi:hypothetical protein